MRWMNSVEAGIEAGAASRGPDHDQRPLGLPDHRRRALDGLGMRGRKVDRVRRHERHIDGELLARDVLRQLEQDGAGALLLRDAERVPHERRDAGRAHDLARGLRERLHRGDDVDDLEPGLPRRHDRLLAGDHHHRHGAELRVGRTGHQVERARPEGRDADAGTPGQAAVGGGHERRRLLVARQHELDRGRPQGLDHVEVLLARHPEDPVDALVLERRHQQVRTLRHRLLL